VYESLESGWALLLWLLIVLGILLTCTGIVKLIKGWFKPTGVRVPGSLQEAVAGRKYRFVLQTPSSSGATQLEGLKLLKASDATEFADIGPGYLIAEKASGEKVYVPTNAILYFEEMT
jgi:hypothetical protein